MALSVIAEPHAFMVALAAQLNALRKGIAVSDSKIHADVSSLDDTAGTADTITTENASDLATSVALANAIKVVINRHYTDGTYAHKAVNTTIATADATDLATGITLGNAIKASYETHRASTTYHYTADATNTIAAADATDQGSLNTLLNELKTDINAHAGSSVAGLALKLRSP